MKRVLTAWGAGLLLGLPLRARCQVPPPPNVPSASATGGENGGGPSENDRRTLQVAAAKREALSRIYQASLVAQGTASRIHLPPLPDGTALEAGSDYAYYMAFSLLNICPAGDFAAAKRCADRQTPEQKRSVLSIVRQKLRDMQDHLQNANIPVNPPPDPSCSPNGSSHGVEAYSNVGGIGEQNTEAGGDVIHLCPDFFVANQTGVSATEEGIRDLVHESAHLAGVNPADGGQESYCYPYNCSLTCAPDQADAWAHLVECLSDAPKDGSGAAAPRVRHGRHH